MLFDDLSLTIRRGERIVVNEWFVEVIVVEVMMGIRQPQAGKVWQWWRMTMYIWIPGDAT